LLTGKQLWSYTKTAARYDTVIAGEGPRATPTVVSNRVFTCGGTGILNCLDLATGKRGLVARSGRRVWRENSAMGLHLRAIGGGRSGHRSWGRRGFALAVRIQRR
jgi:hypothetical protein